MGEEVRAAGRSLEQGLENVCGSPAFVSTNEKKVEPLRGFKLD